MPKVLGLMAKEEGIMSTMWFDKQAGGLPVNEEDGVAVLHGVPDYVRLPAELGGNQANVVSAHMGPCPVTGANVRHLVLDCGVSVAESNQFYWYKTPEGNDAG
jgi:hypothetical protein